MIGFAMFLAAASADAPHAKSLWREQATEADKRRLESWETALNIGRDGVINGSDAVEIKKRAPLFEHSAAMPNSNIPAGLYNCSITKLDGNPDGGLPYIAYPAFKCRVVDMGNRKHFTKLTGSQMTIGWIYKASRNHSIYLGTLMYGYENVLTPYGKEKDRDQAAVVQRIGKNRWRMIFPYPYFESQVDVMELAPVK